MYIPCFFVKLNFFFILTWLKLVFTCDFFPWRNWILHYCVSFSESACRIVIYFATESHKTYFNGKSTNNPRWHCDLRSVVFFFQYGGVLMLVLLLLVGGSVMGFMLKGKVSLVGSIESRGTMVRGLWWYSNTCLIRILCNLFHSVIRFWYIPFLQIP